MTEKEPEKPGLTCETCGEFYPFPPYVYAHWDIPLTFQCRVCNAKYEVLGGHGTVIQPGRAQ